MSYPSLSHSLKPIEAEVLAAIVEGKSVTQVAREAGIHRSTIYNWMNRNPQFATALRESMTARTESVLHEIMEMAGDALDAIRQIVTSEDCPRATRLRAAMAIVDIIRHTRPAADPNAAAARDFMRVVDNLLGTPAREEKMKHYAASAVQQHPAEPFPQTPRNALCPCGSGLKFKRCCGNAAPPVLYAPGTAVA